MNFLGSLEWIFILLVVGRRLELFITGRTLARKKAPHRLGAQFLYARKALRQAQDKQERTPNLEMQLPFSPFPLFSHF
jgi:hypothetical protein